MKILIVGMSDSIHVSRWVSQIEGMGADIRFFANDANAEVHSNLRNIIISNRAIFRNRFQKSGLSGLEIKSESVFRYLTGQTTIAKIIRRLAKFILFNKGISRTQELEKAIRYFRPDIIHSMETQVAGYLVYETKKLFEGQDFPAWLHTNWGSDIYLFGRLVDHRTRIREVLGSCDYYSCECQRDVTLARDYGFNGEILPVFPNSGGFDLGMVFNLRSQGVRPSKRKVILVKGYQGWAGRAFCGLRAIARCGDLLEDYRVIVYANDSLDMKIAAELLSNETGIPVTVLDRGLPHERMMELHGSARISIGLSISDAISTSLLEAMVMGSFPIQSWTSAADEWIENGVSGILVPPEDPDVIELAIRKALSDDGLVDMAMDLNWSVAEGRLDASKLRALAIQGYLSIYEKAKLLSDANQRS